MIETFIFVGVVLFMSVILCECLCIASNKHTSKKKRILYFVCSVIFVLLCSYSGLFDDYGTVNESLLAQRIQVDRSTVVSHFRQLSKMGMIVYNEQSETPWIFFVEEILTVSVGS